LRKYLHFIFEVVGSFTFGLEIKSSNGFGCKIDLQPHGITKKYTREKRLWKYVKITNQLQVFLTLCGSDEMNNLTSKSQTELHVG